MDIKELKELIDATIYPNGEKKIKASSHQSMLHEMVDYTDKNITTINEGLEDVKSTLETQVNDIEGLKESNKQTELNDAKVNQKIDNLASNIVGLGGDIKGSVKGSDVIELPSVAINGVAPKAKIEGLTLVNQVDGVAPIKLNSSAANNAFKISGDDGDNIYMYTLVDATSDNSDLSVYAEDIIYAGLISGKYKGMFTKIINLKDGGNKMVGYYARTGDVIVSNRMYINLTQMFGKGNEPTKEWCDKHIKGYINGVQSVQTPLRVSTWEYVNEVKNGYIKYLIQTTGSTPTIYEFANDIKVGEELTFSFNSSVDNIQLVFALQRDSKYITEGRSNRTFKLNTDIKKGDRLRVYQPSGQGASNLFINNIQFLRGGENKPYKRSPFDFNSSEYSSIGYINSETTLKSALKAKDYIENGTLFKNVFTTKEFKKDDIRRQYINENLVNTYAFYFDIEENIWLKDGFSDNTNRIALFSDGETYSCVGSTIETDVEDIIFFIESGRNYIMLKINRSKIDGLSGATPLDKFKAYMGNRSLIINYQANTEQIKLDTSGVVTTKPNGTIFIENIKNVTDFYTANGLDVKDFKELVSIYKYEGSNLVQLDASKAVFTTTLKHPDLIDGDLVFFEYKYLDSPLWGDNEIEYFNKNNVLQSENGKLWQKVETATNDGQLTTKLEEIK